MRPHTIITLALLSCTVQPAQLAAQSCMPMTNAVAGATITVSAGGNDNYSAVVYNPLADLYYTLDAGSSLFPADTYDGSFTWLSTVTQGFDYRGAWWNPNTAQLEGNGFAALGIYVHDLDPTTHYPLGTGAVILPGAQPDAQSIGAYDPAGDVILYYFNGSIHRYARATNALLGITTITGLPVNIANLNSNTVCYTGCPGYELALYDYLNRRVLFVDGSTFAYAGACQLPVDAPARASFGMSLTNDLFWLFDGALSPGTWHSYQVLTGGQSVAETSAADIRLFPNPAQELLTVSITGCAPARAVHVVDDSGRAVPCMVRRTDAGTYQLEVGKLANGSYALLVDADGGSVRRTFTVAR